MSGAAGRFQSVDPGNAGADAGDPQTWNGYSYVGNNPLSFTDPSGMFTLSDGGAIGLAVCGPVCAGVDIAVQAGIGLLFSGVFSFGGATATISPGLVTPSSPILGSTAGLGFRNCKNDLGGCPKPSTPRAKQTKIDAKIALWYGRAYRWSGSPVVAFFEANRFMYVMTKTGGPWDFKNQPYRGAHPELDDYGNCHFGVVGQAVGLPDLYTRWAAGAASYWHFSSKRENTTGFLRKAVVRTAVGR